MLYVTDAGVPGDSTSDQSQESTHPRPPTRRLTGLPGHSLLDQQRSSLSLAATDTSLPEEATSGQMLLA